MRIPLINLLYFLSLTGFAFGLSRVERISGNGFNDAFDYESIHDPTDGRVNYVNKATALARNLTFASGNHFILRADHTTKLKAQGPGRNSVRLMSKRQYENFAMVFDILHMPQGCGTWPAVWTRGNNWPNEGEIDILEGVNDKGPNHSTLHTGPECAMPPNRLHSGTPSSNNCVSSHHSDAGCGVTAKDDRSFGPAFNRNGGGWYAVERSNDYIKIWFWSRNDKSVPSGVKNGAETVDTRNWGVPVAFFPNNQCNIAKKFGPQNIIINLSLCGQWAGSPGAYRGCPSTCVDYVNSNPAAFSDAYFDFASINIYQ